MTELLDDPKKLVELISSKTGKEKKEIEELIEKKKQRFSGLLTDSGAAFIIAKELGVDLNIAQSVSEKIKIAQLEEGMNGIEIEARVLQVFSPKKFEKGEKKGIVRNLLIGDDTGQIRIALWHNDAKRIDELKVQRNAVLKFRNCYVSSFNEIKQLNLAYGGEIEFGKENNELPGPRMVQKKIGELSAGMDDVDVFGIIERIFPKREFETEKGKGDLVNFELSEGKEEKVRGTAWNNMAKEILSIERGDAVKIEGAYTKEGLNGSIELHLGWKSRIIKNPIMPEWLKAKERTIQKISELNGKEGEIEARGKIIALNPTKLFFNSCSKCNGKVFMEEENKFVCNKCGEVKPAKKLFVSFVLDDSSGKTINAVAFGEQAEKLLDNSTEALLKKAESTSIEEIIEEAKSRIVGKEVSVRGYAKINSMREELEIMARNISFS